MAVQHKTEQIGVRVTPGQMAAIQARAEADGFNVAEWVRIAAIEKARRDESLSTARAA